MNYSFEEKRVGDELKGDAVYLEDLSKVDKTFNLASNAKSHPTLATSLSQDKLENLKETKPSEYLKLMASAQRSFTKKCLSSSTISGRD